MTFDYDKVKDILVCPNSRDSLIYDGSTLVSVNPDTRWSYPIVDDIPRLLAEEGEQLSQETWAGIMERHQQHSGESSAGV